MINQNIVGLLEWLDGERLIAKGHRAATIENHLRTVLEMQNLLAKPAPESPNKERLMTDAGYAEGLLTVPAQEQPGEQA